MELNCRAMDVCCSLTAGLAGNTRFVEADWAAAETWGAGYDATCAAELLGAEFDRRA